MSFAGLACVQSKTTYRASGSDTGSVLGAPDWIEKAVGYEVFVRSFADSDSDGIGDLKGLQSKLDYLNDGKPGGQDLEIDLLWLTPIHPAPSYHGYDVTDFYAVHPQLGSLEDFRQLIKQAHSRGMRVVLDLVVNHTSREHPWFLEACASKDSPRRDWYLWRRDDPGWKRPWGGGWPVWHSFADYFYYAIFWVGMPDLNFNNPAVVGEIEKIVEFWQRLGVDGFRVDAARYFVEDHDGTLADTGKTHQVAKTLKRILRKGQDDSVLLAEVWTKTEIVADYAGQDDEYDLAFNFDLAGVLPVTLLAEEPDEIEKVLGRVEKYFSRRGYDAPFFENHDFDRLRTKLSGREKPLALAAVLLMTLPGTPFIYYGQEIGMANALGCEGDVCRRAPMQWAAGENAGFSSVEPWTKPAQDFRSVNVAAQNNDSASLLNLYRRLIKLRREQPALTSLERRRLATNQAAIYAYLRGAGDHPVGVILNFSQDEKQASLDLSSLGKAGQVLPATNLLNGRKLSFPIDRKTVALPRLEGYGYLIIGF
ncbi:MAG: DUF3459 domain-containing protein [Deltaproteobacteria bacterium]|nr:DUF3459 domain-containing protein [Deltaproteobacteria bacterium]